MRIISKFHDYYDGVMRHGMDKDTVFVRNTEPILNERSLIKFEESLDASKANWYLNPKEINKKAVYLSGGCMLLFCGKLYYAPIITSFDIKSGRLQLDSSETTYYWDKDDIDRYIGDEGRFFNRKSEFKPIWNDINDNTNISKTVLDLHFTYSSPIIMSTFAYTYRTREYKLTNIVAERVINPKLSDVGFVKKMGPYEAFQEIYVFVSGVMGGRSPKIIEISDEIRIAKHGFDSKSFRKDKKDK